MRTFCGIFLVALGLTLIWHGAETPGGIMMITGMLLAHELVNTLLAAGLFVAGVICAALHPLLGLGLFIAAAVVAPSRRS